MINDQYFPFEVNIMHNDEICHLLQEMGAEGWGIYVFLLIELRKHDNYRCRMHSIWNIARSLGTKESKVKRVICNYSLFTIEKDGATEVFFSPYINRVMHNLEEKRRKRSEAGKRGALVRHKKGSIALTEE